MCAARPCHIIAEEVSDSIMKKINFDDYTNDYNKMLRQQTEFFTSDETYFAQYKVQIVRDKIIGEPRH